MRAFAGAPLSAYTAHFGAGARADLPAPYAEVWVVLRGRLRIVAESTERGVDSGSYLYVPANSVGRVEAIEDTTLVCVSVPAH